MMTSSRRPGALIPLTALDQAMYTGSNYAVILVALAEISIEDVGRVSLVLLTANLCRAVARAALLESEAALVNGRYLLAWVVAVIAALFGGLSALAAMGSHASLVAVAVVCATVAHELVRSRLILLDCPGTAVLTELAWWLVLVVAFVLEQAGLFSLTVHSLLIVLYIAPLLGFIVGWLRRPSVPDCCTRRVPVRVRFSVAGERLLQVGPRFMLIWALALVGGAAPVGTLRLAETAVGAFTLLLDPAPVILALWARRAVEDTSGDAMDRFRRLCRRFRVVSWTLCVVIGFGYWIGRDSLGQALLGPAATSAASAVALLAIHRALSAHTLADGILLRSLGKHRTTLKARALGLPAAIGTAVILYVFAEPTAALVAASLVVSAVVTLTYQHGSLVAHFSIDELPEPPSSTVGYS